MLATASFTGLEAVASAGPNWAEILAAVSTFGAMLIVGGTAWYARGQLNDARRTRDGQLLIELSRRWEEPLVIEAQKLFARYTGKGIIKLIDDVYDPSGAKEKEAAAFTALEAIPNLWETLGVLNAEKAISLSVIDRMWGEAIKKSWTNWQKPIEHLRAVTKTPTTYGNFERLAGDLREYEPKKRLVRRLLGVLGMRKWRPPKEVRLRKHLRDLLHRAKQ